MNSKLNHLQNWPELAKQSNWEVRQLATKLGVSVRTLERRFEEILGKKPKLWLAQQRQLHAAKLLRDGHTIKETANYLGYKHPSHLTNDFKKYWGHPPTVKQVQ